MSTPTQVPVTSPATGFDNFSVAHGLGRVPGSLSHLVMTSGGKIWFQSVKWDTTNVYLVATAPGLTAVVFAY